MPDVKLAYDSLDEVPEDMREYSRVVQNGDKTEIYYNPDGLLSAFQKEKLSNKERKKIIDELQAKLIESATKPHDDDKKEETKNNGIDPNILELKKQIAQLQETNKQKDLQNKQQTKQAYMQQLGNAAGLQPMAVSMFDSQIGIDDNNEPYVIDVDGTPKINANGERMKPEEYLRSQKAANPWLFVNNAASPQTKDAASNSNPTIKSKLVEQAEKAKEVGDIDTQMALIRKARNL